MWLTHTYDENIPIFSKNTFINEYDIIVEIHPIKKQIK